MTPIEDLRDELRRQFPAIAAEIDAPADERGLWHLDVRHDSETPWIVVEWKRGVGFGVSTPDGNDFGMNADEFYLDIQTTFARVVQLIRTKGRTSPPDAIQRAELGSAPARLGI